MLKPNQYVSTVGSLLLAVVFALTLVACDSGGDNQGDVQNEFSFDITEVSPSSDAVAATKERQETSLNGFSFFFEGTDPSSDEEVFLIYFTQNNELGSQSSSSGLFGFAVRNTLRPGTANYNFVSLESDPDLSADFGMMLFESVENFGTGGGSAFSWYLSDGGTMQITTSADDRVEGTISADAMRVFFDGSTADTTRVTIGGEFTAKNADSFVGVSPFTP